MSTAKIAITIDQRLLSRIDGLVIFLPLPRLRTRSMGANRERPASDLQQQITRRVRVRKKLTRLDRSRLARECAKLDPKFEQALAEEGISQDLAEWPEY